MLGVLYRLRGLRRQLPDGLIHLEHGRAVIDPAPCEDCNICSYVCPNGVIAARAMPEYVYLQTKALAAQKGGAAK